MKLTKENVATLNDFVHHCAKKLSLKGKITVKLAETQTGMPTAGYCNPHQGFVFVAVKNRAIADVLRTIAHELTHCKQAQRGVRFPEDDEGLQPYEDEANTMSGRLVRFWGRENRKIYEDLA